MRSDARRRREALLTAGEHCFREDGFNVPLEQIADRAGVGRGTLYRNFKDRDALALAIFDRQVDALKSVIDLGLPFEQGLTAFVRQAASGASLFQRIGADLLLDEPRRAAFESLRDRLLGYLAPLVDKAHADGALRADVGPYHVLIAASMINGIVKPHLTAAEIDARIAEGLALLMRGMRPSA